MVSQPPKQRPWGEAYARPRQPTAAATGFLTGGQAFPGQVLHWTWALGKVGLQPGGNKPYRFIFDPTSGVWGGWGL